MLHVFGRSVAGRLRFVQSVDRHARAAHRAAHRVARAARPRPLSRHRLRRHDARRGDRKRASRARDWRCIDVHDAAARNSATTTLAQVPPVRRPHDSVSATASSTSRCSATCCTTRPRTRHGCSPKPHASRGTSSSRTTSTRDGVRCGSPREQRLSSLDGARLRPRSVLDSSRVACRRRRAASPRLAVHRRAAQRLDRIAATRAHRKLCRS